MADTVITEIGTAGASDTSRSGAGRPVHRPARHRMPVGTVVAVLVLAVVLAWAIAPALFTAANPLVGDGAVSRQAPSFAHPFGTDVLGRDLFARVVHGTRASLQATAIAIAVAFVASTVIGLVSGFVGGWLDEVLMRIVDIMLAVPSLLVSLLLVTALGFGTTNVAIAVGVGSVAAFSRVLRAEVLRVRTAAYVEAAEGGGARWWDVLLRHVLPHAITPILALVALEFGTAILAIASLNFLGYGSEPPAPDWGGLVADGRNQLATAWWITTLPGLVIVAVVVAANQLSREIGARR